MSAEMIGKVWRIDFPTPQMKLVALKLADQADSDGCKIVPSVESLSIECGVSKSDVSEILARLQETGVLVVESTGHGDREVDSTSILAFDLDVANQITLGTERRARSPSRHNARGRRCRSNS